MFKILHIITGLNQGGAESILVKLIENYKKEDVFYVVSLTGRGYYSNRIEKSCEVYHFEFNKLSRLLFDFIKLIRLLRLLKPDVVQTWMYHSDLIGGLLSKIFTKSKIFWNIRNGNIDAEWISKPTWVVAKLCSWISSFIPDVIICCSAVAAKTHIEFGYDQRKVKIINNGVLIDQLNINHSPRAEVFQKLAIPTSAITFGNLSRWHPIKGHRTLIEAFKRVTLAVPNQEIYLLLVGKGLDNQNKELINLLTKESMRERVKLLGSTNDINSAFNLMDIHVLSSIGEAFPNVVAEAMACGVQCVVTDVGDASLILGDNRFVSPANDPQKLALCMIKAIEYIKTEDKYAIKNRDRIIQNFSIQKMCSAYHQIWHNLALQLEVVEN